MNLDAIYKTKVGESHEAGLQAVYDAGCAAGAEYERAQNQTIPEVPADLKSPAAPAGLSAPEGSQD